MSNGHNIKGGSNGHFNHVDPIRGHHFFSLVDNWVARLVGHFVDWHMSLAWLPHTIHPFAFRKYMLIGIQIKYRKICSETNLRHLLCFKT